MIISLKYDSGSYEWDKSTVFCTWFVGVDSQHG